MVVLRNVGVEIPRLQGGYIHLLIKKGGDYLLILRGGD